MKSSPYLLLLVLPVMLFGQDPRQYLPSDLFAQPRLTAEEEATIERGLDDLESGNAEHRAGAVMLLGKYRAPAAQHAVVQALNDESARVRRAALVSISEWQQRAPAKAVLPVLQRLGDPDVEVRRMASSMIDAMMMVRRSSAMTRGTQLIIGPELRVTIRQAFTDQDAQVRRNMINSYYLLNDLVPDQLLLDLIDDPARAVRLEALTLAARHTPIDQYVAKVQRFTESDDRAARQRIVSELGRFPSPSAQPLLAEFADDSDRDVSNTAMLALLRVQPDGPWMNRLIERVKEGNLDRDRMARFFRILQAYGERANEVIPQLLDHRDAFVRENAVRIYLSNDLASDESKALGQFLRDRSKAVRDVALEYLRRRTHLLSQELVDDMLFSPHLEVRETLLTMAGTLERNEARGILIDLLLDEKVAIRTDALEAIVSRKLTGWRKLLETSLDDPNLEMQKASLRLLLTEEVTNEKELLERFVEKHPRSPLTPFIERRLEEMNAPVPQS